MGKAKQQRTPSDDVFDPTFDLFFHTKAYVAALEQLADAVAQFDPAEVELFYVGSDLITMVQHRHPAFDAACDAVRGAAAQRRKQAGIEKRSANAQRKKAQQREDSQREQERQT